MKLLAELQHRNAVRMAGLYLVGTRMGVASAGNLHIGHRGMAIDTSATSLPDGPTANDAGDADSGGNRLQHSPDVVDAVPVGADRWIHLFPSARDGRDEQRRESCSPIPKPSPSGACG